MSYVATATFQTTLRRLKAGDPVNESDELAPHTIDSLKAAGLITVKEATAPMPFSRKPAAPAAGED